MKVIEKGQRISDRDKSNRKRSTAISKVKFVNEIEMKRMVVG